MIDNLVSIITPAYNASLYISETIESVLRQTYQNWEMIIIDDCSTDGTLEIVKKYQKNDTRIKLIKLPSNQGVSKARNEGLNEARGRYIAFLDSDDIWLEQKIERQLLFMQENDISFSFTQYRHFKQDLANQGKLIDVPGVIDYKKLLKGNVIGCLTVMIDSKRISNLYIPNVKHEDYAMWLAILKKGYKAYGIKEDLARYRLSSTSISYDKKKSAIWTWNIYRNVEKLSLLKTLYYFLHYAVKATYKKCYL